MNKQLYSVRVSVPFEEHPQGTKTEMLALTPKQALKYRCLDCCGGEKSEIKNCNAKSCSFHAYRKNYKGKISVKLIREFCKSCMNWGAEYIKDCTDKECSLYPYRFGTNPNIQLNEEVKKQFAKTLEENRKRKRSS
jgi:hypothetical protein